MCVCARLCVYLESWEKLKEKKKKKKKKKKEAAHVPFPFLPTLFLDDVISAVRSMCMWQWQWQSKSRMSKKQKRKSHSKSKTENDNNTTPSKNLRSTKCCVFRVPKKNVKDFLFLFWF